MTDDQKNDLLARIDEIMDRNIRLRIALKQGKTTDVERLSEGIDLQLILLQVAINRI